MFLGTNHLKDTREKFPGGYCQGAIIFGVVFREQSSRGQLSGGQFSSGAIIWGEIVREAIFLGGNCPDTPPNKAEKIEYSNVSNILLQLSATNRKWQNIKRTFEQYYSDKKRFKMTRKRQNSDKI